MTPAAAEVNYCYSVRHNPATNRLGASKPLIITQRSNKHTDGDDAASASNSILAVYGYTITSSAYCLPGLFVSI